MISPEELLAAADNICGIADTEPLYRAAISRLYYSAFHKCSDFEKKLPFKSTMKIKKGGMHKKFFARLGNPDQRISFDEQMLSIALGKELRGLHSLRVKADYHLNKSLISQDDMVNAQKKTENIFSAID